MTEKTKNQIWWSGLAAVWILGFTLRLYHITDQILLDDEWHGLLFVARKTLARVAMSSSRGATSVLSNIYYWLTLHSVGWSETIIRLPAILSGLGCLLLFPFIVKKLLNRRVALLSSYLFAISPLLVFYTRNSRPYSQSLLFYLPAFFSLYQWIREGKRRDMIAYGVCSAFAMFFNLSNTLSVFCPLAVAGGLRLLNRIEGLRKFVPKVIPKGRYIALTGVLILYAVFLFYLPTLIRSPWLLDMFQNILPVSFETYWKFLSLISGTSGPFLKGCFLFCLMMGLILMIKKKPLLGWLCASVPAAYGVAVFFLPVSEMRVGLVGARYALSAFPLMLMAVAYFLNEWMLAMEGMKLKGGFPFGRAGSAALFSLLLMLFITGPLIPLYAIQPNNFSNHTAYQEAYNPLKWKRGHARNYLFKKFKTETRRLPYYYQDIAQDPKTHTLIEYPMVIGDHFNRHYYYQQLHKKRVIVGYFHNLLPLSKRYRFVMGDFVPDFVLSTVRDSSKLKFKNMIDMLDIDAVRRSGAGYAVLHKNILYEMSPYRKPGPQKPYKPAFFLAEKYRDIFGEPVYEGKHVIVFRLTDQTDG